MNIYDPKPRDDSEKLDPNQAADELIEFARWLKKSVGQDRLPDGAVQILKTLKEAKQGRQAIVASLTSWGPTRDEINELKTDMKMELFGFDKLLETEDE